MRRTAILTGLLATALLAIGLSASTASATVLCKTATNPCSGGTYGVGTTIEASLKTGTQSVLHPPFGEIKCSEASVKGEVTNTGGEGNNVTGTVTGLNFGNCNATVHILNKGTFRIESTGGGNGTLVLEGFETTVEFAGFHCIFSGPASLSLNGGAMASASTSGTTLPRTGGKSGKFCGENAPQWTAEYTIMAPEPLYVAEREAIPTVLCKTATNPCSGGAYGVGTTIEASLKAGTLSVLDAVISDIECEEASIKGEVTGAGGETSNVTGTVTGLAFGKCKKEATVDILKKGTFRIEATSGGNGVLVLENFETTLEFAGFHCIFSGPASLSLNGGAMASASTSGTTLPRTGGKSGKFCGENAPQWTAEYTITAPEPLYAVGP